ncbi:MAG: flagellar export chaperone FlgN [Leptospiraceae bacterium]|nr:flagellar export chaperone FlgN [Leptospiraceae bacterium]
MIQVQPESVKDLEYILKEEISVYKSILLLETNKKESIMKSKGKELESATKQISHLLTIATEVETRRQQALNKMFSAKNIKPQGEQIIFNEFLSNVEDSLKDRFSRLADDLRKIVLELKEQVQVNEKLLKAKQEIFQLTMEVLKDAAPQAAPEVSYEVPSKQKSTRTSVMLNREA